MTGYQQGPDWCMTKPVPIKDVTKRPEKIPFMRCPDCGRRLQLKIIDTSGYGEYAMMYPAHKLRKTKRKK